MRDASHASSAIRPSSRPAPLRAVPTAPCRTSTRNTLFFVLCAAQGDGVPVFLRNATMETKPRQERSAKVAIAGGVPVTLASGQSTPYGIAIDKSFVYWTNSGVGQGSLARVPIGGGETSTLAAGYSSATGLAVDAASIYWVADGELLKLPISGVGTPSVLATDVGQNGEDAVQLTGDSVLYFDAADNLAAVSPK
jgi:hypothetical protein